MDDTGKSVGPVAWRACKRDLIAQSCPEGESQYLSRSSRIGPGYFRGRHQFQRSFPDFENSPSLCPLGLQGQ